MHECHTEDCSNKAASHNLFDDEYYCDECFLRFSYEFYRNFPSREILNQNCYVHGEAGVGMSYVGDSVLNDVLFQFSSNEEEPKTREMTSLDIILFDCSGSMDTEFTTYAGHLSIKAIRIIGHAIRTILHSLKNTSHGVSVIAFPGDPIDCLEKYNEATASKNIVPHASKIIGPYPSKIIVPPGLIKTDDDLAAACAKVEAIDPQGITTMWQAIKDGLEIAIKYTEKNFPVRVHLFTDGYHDGYNAPANYPDCGMDVELGGIMKTLPYVTLHTYGLGNTIDSELLLKLANTSPGGIFKHMPSPDMVLPNVINSIVSILCNVILCPPPGHDMGIKILQEILYHLTEPSGCGFDNAEAVLREGIITMSAKGNPLAKTLETEVYLALQRSCWADWGRHYLRSLLSSYRHCHCGNSKDHALQPFAIQDIRDRIEKIAETIPSPKGVWVTNNFDMDKFIDEATGCIATSCRIIMADGQYKRLSEVRVGDMVASYDFLMCRQVKATVQWIRVNKNESTIKFGDLIVTPGHPILHGASLINCVDISGWVRGPITDVCNLLLDCGHCVFTEANWISPIGGVFVDGKWCGTLGNPAAYNADWQPLDLEWRHALLRNFVQPTEKNTDPLQELINAATAANNA